MNNFEQTVRSRFPDLVLLGCLLGFAGIWFELYGIRHFREGSQVIGYASTIIGLLACALGFVRVPFVRILTLLVLALLAVAGVYGLNEHRETRAKDYVEWQQRHTQVTQTATTDAKGDGEEAGRDRAFRSDIPVLAPASLSGLSALAFLAILARRRPEASVMRSPGTATPPHLH